MDFLTGVDVDVDIGFIFQNVGLIFFTCLKFAWNDATKVVRVVSAARSLRNSATRGLTRVVGVVVVV